MQTIDVIIEHDINIDELKDIAKEVNGTLDWKRIIINKDSYIELSSSLQRTRAHYDYDFDYKDKDKLDKIREIPTYHTITLVNIKDKDKILKVLRNHDIYECGDMDSENPFYINGEIFEIAKINSIEDDLKCELYYHHGDGSLYKPGYMPDFESCEAKREFIDWLDKTIPHSWYYDQNWNYVTYLAAAESTIRLCRNPKTLSLFPEEMKEKIEKNRAYIVAAMVCTKTGVKDQFGNEYVCIEDIITRVRGIELSRLLFYKYLRHESEYEEGFGWVPKIELIPGDIVETAVPFWYHMLDDLSLCSSSSYEIADQFYERSKRLAKHKELDRNWQELYDSLYDRFNANVIFPRLKNYLCDDSEYYYSKHGNDEILIKGVGKGEEMHELEFKDKYEEKLYSDIHWQGPVQLNEFPIVEFKDHYGDDQYISLKYYVDDFAKFFGDEEAIHRIWAVLECIRRHGKYDEKHMLEIEREEEEDENEED